MKKYPFTILISCIILLFSCNKEEEADDLLSLPTQNYSGDEIKLNGYWYSPTINNNEEFCSYSTFFYKNGVIFGGVSFLKSKISEAEEEFSNGEFYTTFKNKKYYWGKFIVEDSIIFFERWYSGEPPLQVFLRTGKILNDSTFHISEVYRVVDGERIKFRDIDETYHLKHLKSKPDSINSFVN